MYLKVEDVIVTKEFFLNAQYVQTYVEVYGMLCRVKAPKSVLLLTIHGHLCSCNIKKAMTCDVTRRDVVARLAVGHDLKLRIAGIR